MPDAPSAWLDRVGAEHPRGVERGLDHVRVVADRLGVLPAARKRIVVAGTNGKGSTTAFAEQLLVAAGHSVGTTTSPHLHRFNERIRLDGAEVDDEAIVGAFEAIASCRREIDLSYFEYATLAALLVMSRRSLDCAVLEVGLGGRLDAVNVVDADVAVITTIALEHQEYLGDTRELIGTEKAGVMRVGKPVVCGDPDPPGSIVDRARELRAPLLMAGRDFGHEGGEVWFRAPEGRARRVGLSPSAVDPVNAATAVQALCAAGFALTEQTVVEACRSVRNPGRLETLQHSGMTWILDVAHNPNGADFLCDRLRALFAGRRIRAVVGCLADKDVRGIVGPLRPLVAEFAYADTRSPRGRSGAELRAACDDLPAFAGALDDAVDHVLSRCDNERDVILVFGSFDVVERVRDRLDCA